MAKKKIGFVPGAVVIILFSMTIAVAAQVKDAVSYPDINVMNSILEQLLKGVDSSGYESFDVSGSYIPGYGLLFVLNRAGINVVSSFLAGNSPHSGRIVDFRAFDSSMAVFDSTMAHYDFSMRKYDSAMTRYDSSIARSMPHLRIPPPKIVLRNPIIKEREGFSKEEIEKLDAQIMKFLESYADAENILSPGQRVSLVVFLDHDSPAQARYYTVSRKQISDYRTKAETQTAFREMVQIGDLKEHDNSIDIMATILDKSINDRTSGDDHLMFGPNSTGIYLKGLGAFFVCRMTGFPDFDYLAKKSRQEKERTAQIEKLVIRTLGNYGASLRFLPDDESILVSLQLDSFGSRDESILISMKKKDIDSYSMNEISFDTLRQRTTVVQNQ